MVRLFVALALPDSLRAQLSEICAGIPGARWVPAENFHLTLRFIGEVSRSELPEIDDALSHLAAAPIEVVLDSLGFFGRGRAIRALWVRAERSPELVSLQAKVESAMVRAGCAPETRKFFPHITLARLKRAQSRAVEQFVADHSMFKPSPFPVRALTLYSSFLAHTGAIYTPEGEYPLALS